MAGLFNKNDQSDFSFNVNGKEVSGEEGAQYAKEFADKMTTEMTGLVSKLTKNATSKITGIDALKDKIPSNLDLDSIREKVMPIVKVDSIKEYLNPETFSKLQEKLPVIDASNDDGNIKLNVNGKPLFTLNLSDFMKK